jgi:hypothetical protein
MDGLELLWKLEKDIEERRTGVDLTEILDGFFWAGSENASHLTKSN